MYRYHHRQAFGELTPPPDYYSDDSRYSGNDEENEVGSMASPPHGHGCRPSNCVVSRGRYPQEGLSRSNNSPNYDRYVCYKGSPATSPSFAESCYPHPHQQVPHSTPACRCSPSPSCSHHTHADEQANRTRHHVHYHKHYRTPSGSCNSRFAGSSTPPAPQAYPHPHARAHAHARAHSHGESAPGGYTRHQQLQCQCPQCCRAVPDTLHGVCGCQRCQGRGGAPGHEHSTCSPGHCRRRVYGPPPPMPVFLMGFPRGRAG